MTAAPTPVTVMIAYQAQPDQVERTARELRELIQAVVEAEHDCRGIRLLQDTASPERFVLVELWSSAEAFTGPHMQTPHLQAFIQRAGSFLAGPPEIRLLREAGTASRGERESRVETT